jgi:hypothetical protein
MNCSGKCDRHIGTVRKVLISGFGEPYEDFYCEEAIRYDRKQGFFVQDSIFHETYEEII